LGCICENQGIAL